MKEIFKKKFLVENFIQKKPVLLHHARGVLGQDYGDAPRVKTVRARVFKKTRTTLNTKIFSASAQSVNESEKLEPNWDGEIAILDDF